MICIVFQMLTSLRPNKYLDVPAATCSILVGSSASGPLFNCGANQCIKGYTVFVELPQADRRSAISTPKRHI